MSDRSDRTRQAVAKCLRVFAAAGVEQVEIVRRHPEKGAIRETLSLEKIPSKIPALRRANAMGEDIFWRPVGPLVLIDDVDGAIVEQMRRDGHNVPLVVETSHKCFQAWVWVASKDPAERAACARLLAELYGGDLRATDARHLGRMPGFTNRKYAPPPYVLVRSARPSECKPGPATGPLLRDARARIKATQAAQAAQAAQITRTIAARGEDMPRPRAAGGRSLTEWYQSVLDGLQSRFADDLDASRVDWCAAVQMIRRGHRPDVVADVLREASPAISVRKTGHIEDYLRRTVWRAAAWCVLSRQGMSYEEAQPHLNDLARQLQLEQQAQDNAPDPDPAQDTAGSETAGSESEQGLHP